MRRFLVCFLIAVVFRAVADYTWPPAWIGTAAFLGAAIVAVRSE